VRKDEHVVAVFNMFKHINIIIYITRPFN